MASSGVLAGDLLHLPDKPAGVGEGSCPTPILYLPGVSRADLRAVDECPTHLQPLAGIQYGGAFWAHANGKDWTVASFFTSERGLGLDVARDGATQEMLLTALVELADLEVEKLRGKQLSAADLHALLLPDPVKQVLRWLDDPKATRTAANASTWKAFRATCKKQYGFDPDDNDPIPPAAKMGERQKKWDAVWQRFAEAPGLYPRLPDRLRAARPPGMFRSEAWPQDNEGEEANLRQALLDLPGLPPARVPVELRELEERHGPRREWVWAKMGWAPLALALHHLAELAAAAERPLSGATPQAMGEAYAASGWKVDAALLAALNAVEAAGDVDAVRAAVRAAYVPWLEKTTERFQQLVGDTLEHPELEPKEVPASRCVLFADGLRFDVGQRLRQALEARDLVVEAGWHWSALPPVTPTAKPAVSPVADRLAGSADGEGFCPLVVATSKKLTADRFGQLLADKGFQVLKGADTGAPADGRAWTESGQIDRNGHDLGWKMVRRLDEEVRALAERVASLLSAGWREVQVVTDHGWLLLPGGLPKFDLPGHMAQDRWGRCAVLTAGSMADVRHALWHWSSQVWVALAPGIHCFVAGKDYAHGSLSLQECLVPRSLVRAKGRAGPLATIRSVKWTGLRCRVQVDGDATALLADVRTRPADPATSLAPPKVVGADGTVSLLVEDDSAEGAAAVVVLVTAGGEVVARLATAVGAEG